MQTMKANVFHGPNKIGIEEVPRPSAGVGEAVIRITLTTICGRTAHFARRIPGETRTGDRTRTGRGDRRTRRRIVGIQNRRSRFGGAITPAVNAGLVFRAMGAMRPWRRCRSDRRLAIRQHHQWRSGRISARSECAGEPGKNSGRIERRTSRASGGHRVDRIQRRESANIRIGDTVAVFAQGPIGLCATAGAKLIGASFIIGVEGDPVRMEMSKRMGAHVVLDPKQCDVVAEIKKLTGGGADVAIEALGLQVTFENALRCLRPGGTLSSLGVYSGKLQVPYDAFAAGLGDYKIVTTLCPGGKERMRRLMSMVQSKRFDPLPLITHSFNLDQIVEAYDVFGSRRDGCLKVAIKP